MGGFVLHRPRKMSEDLFKLLIGPAGEESEQIFQRKFLVPREKVEPKTLDRLTQMEILVYPLYFSGDTTEAISQFNPVTVDGYQNRREYLNFKELRRRTPKDENLTLLFKGDKSHVIGPAINRNGIEGFGHYGNRYFANTSLMSMLLYLHQDFFGRDVHEFMDPFLGHGGSLISGVAYGATHMVGVEIEHGNIVAARANLEHYLERERFVYGMSKKGDFSRYEIERRDGELVIIEIYRDNSILSAPDIAAEQKLSDYEIISDIPWGHVKCRAHGRKRITTQEDMVEFHTDLGEMLKRTESDRITLAQNRLADIGLPEARRIPVSRLYNIVTYNLNGNSL